MKTIQAPTIEGFLHSNQFEIYVIAMGMILALVLTNWLCNAFMR